MNVLRAMRIVSGVERSADTKILANDSNIKIKIMKGFRRGYSLAELILGAAILAAFLVRVYQSYAATSAADKFEDFNSELGLIAGTTIQQFINAPNYLQIVSGTVPSVISTVLPNKYLDGNGGIVSVYHGPITLTSDTAGDAFIIEADGIPEDACIKAYGEDFGKNFLSVGSTSSDMLALDSTSYVAPGSTDAITAAATACQTGSSNTVAFLIK